MRQAKRRKMDPEGKRLAVLDAAVAELAAKGFAGANTGEIAARAGVGAGTVFRIFPTKEALANAVYRRCWERYDALFPKDIGPGTPPREQFQAMWRCMVGFYERYPADYVFYEIHLHDAFLDADNREMRGAYRARVIKWIEALQAAKVLRAMPPDAARALVLGTFARLVREHLNGNVELTADLTSRMEEECWRAIT